MTEDAIRPEPNSNTCWADYILYYMIFQNKFIVIVYNAAKIGN